MLTDLNWWWLEGSRIIHGLTQVKEALYKYHNKQKTNKQTKQVNKCNTIHSIKTVKLCHI